MQIKKS